MRSSRPSKRQAVPVKRDHYREVARALLDGVCVPALGDGEGNGRMPQVNDRTAPAAAPAWAALTDGVNGREVDDRLTPVVLRRAATPVALLSDQCVEDVDLLVPSREVRVRTRRTPSAWAAATATAGGNQMAKVVTARRFHQHPAHRRPRPLEGDATRCGAHGFRPLLSQTAPHGPPGGSTEAGSGERMAVRALRLPTETLETADVTRLAGDSAEPGRHHRAANALANGRRRRGRRLGEVVARGRGGLVAHWPMVRGNGDVRLGRGHGGETLLLCPSTSRPS
jgi:hypothetical protein